MVKHMVLVWATVVLVGALVSCKDSPGPAPERVDPSGAIEGQTTPVTIHGRKFQPRFHSNFDDKEQATLLYTFTAKLGDVPLLDVRHVDDKQLTATVPGTLEQGFYDLTVRDPGGLVGILPRAFTVSAATPDGGPGDAATDSGSPEVGTPDQTVHDQTVHDQYVHDQYVHDQYVHDLVQPDLLKGLTAPCNQDSECASNHCVKEFNKSYKICCDRDCNENNNNGCDDDGTGCKT